MNAIFIPLIIGASGIIVEIVLFRELIVSYSGNELVLGLVLGNWIVAEALGVYLAGSLLKRSKSPINLLVIFEIVFCVVFFASIYWARVFKGALGIPFGEQLDFFKTFISSLLIIFPVAFCHGALFNCGFKATALSNVNKNTSLGSFYSLETFGTCLGSIVFAYLFIPLLNSFQVASFVAGINLLLMILFFRGSRYATFMLFVVLCLGLVTSDSFQQKSLQLQYKGKQVLESTSSKYGIVTAVSEDSQYTFFTNGVPLISVPYPNVGFVEEFGNLPLLFHDQPKDLLVIGRGAGGLLSEILKHPLASLDYAELDPLLIKMLSRYKSPLTERELKDTRVHCQYTDGRFLVRTTLNKYDLLLLGVSHSADFVTNRMFTVEFFLLTRRVLKENGLLSLWLPGSLSYYSQELKNLNASIINALSKTFPYVRVIPGEYNIILASQDHRIMEVNALVIAERIRKRGLNINILAPGYLEYRLDKTWSSWFENSLQGSTLKANRDLEPFALFAALRLWNRQFSSSAGEGIFSIFKRINLRKLIFLVLIFTLSLRLASLRRGWSLNVPLVYTIATTGFFAMLTNLILLFCFQVFFGYLFHQLGVLIALCMGGMALGGLAASRLVDRGAPLMRFLQSFELLMITLSGLTILLLTHAQNAIALKHAYVILLSLIFFTGLSAGFEFPLAAALFSLRRERITDPVGILYAADLFGGWVAGVFGAAVLIPVLGMVDACVLILVFKVSSFLILLSRKS